MAEVLAADTARRVQTLVSAGIQPTLSILRVGNRPDDLSYERMILKRCAQAGVSVKKLLLPAQASQEQVEQAVGILNQDPSVHGILLMRPLPAPLDDTSARRLLDPSKDVDGSTDDALAGVFAGTGDVFAPCTAQAALELLDYYHIPIQGAHAVVVGRSLVVGRPAAMLLLARGATVTLCHSGTKDLPTLTRQADLVVASIGKMAFLGPEYFSPRAVIVDVGIHYDETSGKLRGDVAFDQVFGSVSAITPVPGGLGSVTTAVLARNVVAAAERILARYGSFRSV